MEFYEVIKKRKSVRKYRPDPIPDDVLNRILDAGRIAPSAKNLQPWHFIVVKDPNIKKELAAACRNQMWMADAAVIVCGCADEKNCYAKLGSLGLSFQVDLAIAIDHMILAATSEGLGTCWIAAYSEEQVKKVLNIPETLRVVCLTPIGWPAETPKDRGRKSLAEIISWGKYKQ